MRIVEAYDNRPPQFNFTFSRHQMARPWLVLGLSLAWRWLTSRNYLPSGCFTPCIPPVYPLYPPCMPPVLNALAVGLWVALRSLARLFKVRGSRFEVQSSVFPISLPNTTPLPRLPGGGLGVPWTIPWTYPGPIDPPQTPVFDQPGLSKSLSGGAATAKGSSKSHIQPPGAAFCPQQGAHEIISPERAPPGLPEWLLEFEPTLMTPFALLGAGYWVGVVIPARADRTCWRRAEGDYQYADNGIHSYEDLSRWRVAGNLQSSVLLGYVAAGCYKHGAPHGAFPRHDCPIPKPNQRPCPRDPANCDKSCSSR
jgi:hypothetical protein